MKYKSIISTGWSLTAALLISASCQELNIDTQPEGTPHMETDVLAEYVRSATSPQKITFNISSTTPWRIDRSEDAEWCDIRPASSALSSLSTEVSISLEDNETYEDREIRLSLSADGIGEKYDIRILQARKGRLFIQPVDDPFEAEGGVQTLTVLSNNDWEILSDNQWITFEPSKGSASNEAQVVKVTAARNNGARRTTNIRFVTGEGENIYEIVQKGYYIEFVDMDNNVIEAAQAGGIIELPVRANIEWTPLCGDDSVILEKDDKNLIVRLPANKYFLPKETVIKLVPSDPELEGMVDAEVVLRQQINAYEVGGTTEIDENGFLKIISTGSGQSRYACAKEYGLGTYIWTFESINLSSEGWIHIQMWPVNDSDNANLNFWFSGGSNYYNTGGTVKSGITGKPEGFWSENYINSSLEELNGTKEIKITILPIENHLEEIAIYFDGNLKGKFSEHPNTWYHKPEYAFTAYYGLYDEPSCASTLVIKSFEIIPYEDL